jgi:hypothetical protein
MAFPAATLRARGGELGSHLFENPRTGLARDHYWSVSVDFHPVEYAGGSWVCSASVDWLRFAVRDWRDLGVAPGAASLDDALIEASFYMTEHDRARLTYLELRYLGGARFRVVLGLDVGFQGYTGDDADPAMAISATTDVSYRGLTIGQGLMPRPSSRAARDLAASVVDPDVYHAPQREGRHFILRPKP